MRQKKKKYIPPKLTKEKIKVNFFWDQSRFFDSLVSIEGELMASCPPSCGCFLPGTNIVLSNGKNKKIESVNKFDKVLSYDTAKKLIEENTVERLMVHNNESQYYIINKNLLVTGNHRIWTNNLQWKRVDELRIGDELLTEKLKPLTIESIERKKKNITVFDLHLKNIPHTFFAENLLVHNNGLTTMEKLP